MSFPSAAPCLAQASQGGVPKAYYTPLLICRRCIYRIGIAAAGWHRVDGPHLFKECRICRRGVGLSELHGTGSRGGVSWLRGKEKTGWIHQSISGWVMPGVSRTVMRSSECWSLWVFLPRKPSARLFGFFFSASLARDALHGSDVRVYRGTCEI